MEISCDIKNKQK